MFLRDRISFMAPGITVLLILAASLACPQARAHDVGHQSTMHRDSDTPSASDPQDEVHALIREFRQTGDDLSLDAAWTTLQPRMEQLPHRPSVLVDAATVAQARHDFDAALALIDRALTIRPYFDQAWLLRASIQLVRGDPEQAQAACNRLRSVPALVAVTCRARVDIASSNHALALTKLTAMLAAVDQERVDRESLAWALSVAGDAAVATDAEAAIGYYKRSLDVVESTQVRAALVDVLLASDRAATARDVLDAGHGALPLDVRRLIVAIRLGETDAVREKIVRTDHEFRHWIADGDLAHAREMARFYIDVIDRPVLAKRLAHINLRVQREPEDVLLARRVTGCRLCEP